METSNNNLETLIKLRHLSEGLTSNWELLQVARNKASNMLDEANTVMKMFGTDKGKTTFQTDLEELKSLQQKIGLQMEAFKEGIKSQTSKNSLELYQEFQKNTEKVSELFAQIGKYPNDHFKEITGADWFNMWAVIQSNIYTVQGIGQSAFIQLQMFEKFNAQEIDDLTKEIIKYIPKSYSMEDALQYKKDYLNAMEQMEEDANKNEYLWDKFLNLLAGNIPFKQTPQERVMMMRWLDGEKGEL